MLYLDTKRWEEYPAKDNQEKTEHCLSRILIDMSEIKYIIDITEVNAEQYIDSGLEMDHGESIIDVVDRNDNVITIVHNYEEVKKLWTQTKRKSIYYH